MSKIDDEFFVIKNVKSGRLSTGGGFNGPKGIIYPMVFGSFAEAINHASYGDRVVKVKFEILVEFDEGERPMFEGVT